jgi:hypothetical protein
MQGVITPPMQVRNVADSRKCCRACPVEPYHGPSLKFILEKKATKNRLKDISFLGIVICRAGEHGRNGRARAMTWSGRFTINGSLQYHEHFILFANFSVA